MKRSFVFLFVAILISILSGCILSKTPTTNDVAMDLGGQMTFSVNVFPSNATYAWTLDGSPLTNTEKSYVYTALGGNHFLIVRATYAFGTDTQAWYIQTPNPPVANAGPDQSLILIDQTVSLDGSGSADPDNDIVSYHWQQTVGPTVTLINSITAIAQFTASVAAGSVLNFELTVSDASGLQSTDTCVVTMSNLPDTINALLSSMVSIPAGSFMMGSTDNEYGHAQYSTPVHQVTLQSFEIGAYEVTQAQYLAVMGTNPSYFRAPSYPDSENNPVETVSWYDARAFCTQLSVLTGRTFTLPSEAQWEYACRARTTTLYSFGHSDALLGDYAWWWQNSNGTGGPYGTHPVGTKPPNPWGLYDMHGNVWEWCLDSWHDNYTGAPTDGSAWEPDTGSRHMVRGGGWFHYDPGNFRSATRGSFDYPADRNYYMGIRVIAIP